jgi:hypothetical protein
MLGSDSGIISMLPSLPKPKMLRLCKSHRLKKKKHTQNLIKRTLKHFECMLPLFSPAQLTSTDPKPATIKNTRNLSQTTLVRTENG